MDNFNWLILEMLMEEWLRDLPVRSLPSRTVHNASRRRHIRTRLAAWLVRVGLRLDPGLADRLNAPAGAPMAPEARQHA